MGGWVVARALAAQVEECDILISHGPPLGVLDMTFRGKRVGWKELADRVREIKPRYHLFGHIHEGYGVTQLETTLYGNASACDLRYRPINPPLVFDIEVRT